MTYQPHDKNPAPIPGAPVPQSNRDLKKYRSRWRAVVRRFIQRRLFGALVRSTIEQNVICDDAVRDVKGAYVLVANHTSHLDAPMLAQCLPARQARFLSTGVATDYFFKIWYRRFFVRMLFNAFPIDRDGSRANSGMSRRLLRYGVPILVFPEGTRSMTGRMGTFKPGSAALASSVGVPVIPAAIIGGYEAMPKGRNWPRPGKPPVSVVFGAPMTAYDDESVSQFTERIRATVAGLYAAHVHDVLGPGVPGKERGQG
ncbi:lysophospholipid acyltransferase family protein [Devriesea agamarum]|uniref:lysophospholipid acyltransferase family protein n=1 Tax=Devriesea agamarum TaxID=472569 RepID=UPI0009FE9EC9|nr:lysophospholipid acyltransferase family protein [Devriesea agamarum]